MLEVLQLSHEACESGALWLDVKLCVEVARSPRLGGFRGTRELTAAKDLLDGEPLGLIEDVEQLYEVTDEPYTVYFTAEV